MAEVPTGEPGGWLADTGGCRGHQVEAHTAGLAARGTTCRVLVCFNEQMCTVCPPEGYYQGS
jgi:hypothetical protein